MIGKTLGHYEITELLGKGGMGEVYRARDTKLGRDVALKFLPSDKLSTERERTRFLSEAKAASALDHPNVGTIFDIQDTDDGKTFIVMALYSGDSLRQSLGAGQLSIEKAIDLGRQIAAGLGAVHAKLILHRDIKPENILLTDDGTAKVVDFGLAKDLGATALTMVAQPMGTAAYMSPEQAKGNPTDHRTDVWALGVLLYEMVGGELPFQGDSAQAVLYQVVNEEPRPVGELRPELPPELAAIIHRAMAKDPQDRFASMEELSAALAAILPAQGTSSNPRNRLAWGAMVGLLIVAMGWIGSTLLREAPRDRAELLIEARQLLGEGRDAEALLLLQSVTEDDPLVLEMLDVCSKITDVESDPPGAKIHIKDYLDVDGDWILLGTTPLLQQRIPKSYLRLRITKDGYLSQELAFTLFRTQILLELVPEADAQEGMIYVPPGQAEAGSAGTIELPGYWLDTYEVTNREFQEFVDAGGYANPTFWTQPFILDGKTLSFAEAQERFKDATGRAGPSTWELGHYPEGEADLPVHGVSWYEAAAYLEFVGKQMPTLHHWRRGAGYGIEGDILLLSNFESDGPAEGGSFQGLSPFGNFDMAGNVQEWCWNEIRGNRFAVGGAWVDAPYEFIDSMDADAHPAFSRAETFGFRGMKSPDPIPEVALEPIDRLVIDYADAEPVGDELFELYRAAYAYDPSPLDARVESSEEFEHWTKEKVSFKAGYGRERVPAYLFLPKGIEPPYQTIVYFPGGSARHVDNSEQLTNERYWDFVIRSGRAVLYPVYQNMYERRLGIPDPGLQRKRETIIQWSKDIQRSIDYLETRPDIDREKIGYYALSLGSTYAPIFMAIENRFRCSIWLSGGLFPGPWTPDVTPLNFLTHVEVPTLMINGRYDFSLPVDTSVKPMFDWMGTADADKQLFFYDGDHVPRANAIVRVTLDWMDRYLGAVR